MKKALIFLSFILLILTVPVFYFLWGLQPAGGETKTFVINRGEALSTIATRLEREGLIRSRLVCLLLLKFDDSYSIQSGSFKIDGKDSLTEVLDQLQKGRLDLWVTILEGWRREEVASKLEATIGIDSQDFIQKTRGKEGYLFPDSYLIPEGASTDQVIAILENNFDKKWQTVSQSAFTQDQILTLASLVEREAKFEQDRAIVAGILIKRWQSDWPLQIDATVQYAKANSQKCSSDDLECDWWPQVFRADLEMNSPYNTYINKGLPPTPICNPSLASIMAVVNYEETDYWYYLSEPTGKTHFSKTLEEHQENISKYLRD